MADSDDPLDDEVPAGPPSPETAARFSDHWLRMSAILLAELKRRDLMDTPEAQAVVGARRRQLRRATPPEAARPRKGRTGKPETRWERFLRSVGRHRAR